MAIDDYISRYDCNAPSYLVDQNEWYALNALMGYDVEVIDPPDTCLVLNYPSSGQKITLNNSIQQTISHLDYNVSFWFYFSETYINDQLNGIVAFYKIQWLENSLKFQLNYSYNSSSSAPYIFQLVRPYYSPVIASKEVFQAGWHHLSINIKNLANSPTWDSLNYDIDLYLDSEKLFTDFRTPLVTNAIFDDSAKEYKLDEIRFYNRKLTDSEVVEVFNFRPNPSPLIPEAPVVTSIIRSRDGFPTWTWESQIEDGAYRYSYDEENWETTTEKTFTPSTEIPSGAVTLYVQVSEDSIDPFWSSSGYFTVYYTEATNDLDRSLNMSTVVYLAKSPQRTAREPNDLTLYNECWIETITKKEASETNNTNITIKANIQKQYDYTKEE